MGKVRHVGEHLSPVGQAVGSLEEGQPAIDRAVPNPALLLPPPHDLLEPPVVHVTSSFGAQRLCPCLEVTADGTEGGTALDLVVPPDEVQDVRDCDLLFSGTNQLALSDLSEAPVEQ